MNKAQTKYFLDFELEIITIKANKGEDLAYCDLVYAVIDRLRDVLLSHGVRVFRKELSKTSGRDAIELYHKYAYCAGLTQEDESRFEKCFENFKNYILK